MIFFTFGLVLCFDAVFDQVVGGFPESVDDEGSDADHQPRHGPILAVCFGCLPTPSRRFAPDHAQPSLARPSAPLPRCSMASASLSHPTPLSALPLAASSSRAPGSSHLSMPDIVTSRSILIVGLATLMHGKAPNGVLDLASLASQCTGARARAAHVPPRIGA